MQAWAAKTAEEDLRFCAAVYAGDLWPVAEPFLPAPGDVRDKCEVDKDKKWLR